MVPADFRNEGIGPTGTHIQNKPQIAIIPAIARNPDVVAARLEVGVEIMSPGDASGQVAINGHDHADVHAEGGRVFDDEIPVRGQAGSVDLPWEGISRAGGLSRTDEEEGTDREEENENS